VRQLSFGAERRGGVPRSLAPQRAAAGCRTTWIVVTLVCLSGFGATAASAGAETATYSATQTIPVPPASNFAGSGGGDGWAVALSETAVYNVFHHNPSALTVACHLQVNAEACSGWPKTISEPGGSAFTSGAQPGMYLDQRTGKLYVYTTRLSDLTGGVLCVDTTSEEADPYCGFTELTGEGEAPLTTNRGISGMSNPMLIGKHWYSFNFVAGTQKGTENTLACFDVGTDAPCAGQPYPVTIPSGNVTTAGNEPVGETTAIAGKAIIPIEIENQTSWIACWDDATQSSCAGAWPVELGFPYVSTYGAPFPLLNATGKTIGLCLPTGTDQCFNLEGEPVTTPEHMTEAIPATEEWNGGAFMLGPRVYLPNGEEDQVDCFDYATGEGCANFPKSFSELGLLYTVNQDPQRPTCIWVNSDYGSQQIQNFDAYTGEACGQGTIRVLASQFVVPEPQCTPASYISLQVLKPARSTYASGSVAFTDGDGNPIGLEERELDATGTASLAGLELNTPTGLPQFLFTLNGENEEIGTVEIRLTWTGDYNASCLGENLLAAPGNVSLPSISGAAMQGQTLTEQHGSWSNEPTSYTYQWDDCDSADSNCTPIPGAIGQTYTLSASDVGDTIRVEETASNASGASSPATSEPTAVVQPAFSGGGESPGGGETSGGDGGGGTPSASTAGAGEPTGAVSSEQASAPVAGRTQRVGVLRGTAKVRVKGTSKSVVLSGASTIPDGSEVDATHGRVLLTVAVPGGKIQSAEVYGGRFVVHQDRRGAGETHLRLSLPLTGCRRLGRSRRAIRAVVSRNTHHAKHRSGHHHDRRRPGPRSRHLWVSESGGAWGTKGRFVSTSVEGTRWLTLDKCTRSKVKVAAGKVKVRDLVRRETRTIAAGKHYVARRK
jgi:hypothetical protein